MDPNAHHATTKADTGYGAPPMMSPPPDPNAGLGGPPGYHQGVPMYGVGAGIPHGQHQNPPMQPYGTQGMQGMPLHCLGSQASMVQCPNCHTYGLTRVSYESGGLTHLSALVVCCITCLGCIPYLISGLKDVHHRCGNCNVPLATYHRSGRTEMHARPPQG